MSDQSHEEPVARPRVGVVTTRPARAIRTRPITRGEVVTLSPDDGRPHQYLTVRAPDGLIMLVPINGRSCNVWALQVGTWTYRWGDGEAKTFDVVEAPPTAPADPSAVDTRLLPPASLTRRPRY